MQQFVFYFTSFLLPTLRADGNEIDGSRGLKRGFHVQGNRVSYGNFAVDKFHRLQVSVGSSSVVSNYRECALNCVNNPPCSSFNVASSPRSDGKYRCELLNEDKHSANSSQLVSLQEFHHYSIKVFKMSTILLYKRHELITQTCSRKPSRVSYNSCFTLFQLNLVETLPKFKKQMVLNTVNVSLTKTIVMPYLQ